MNTQEVIDHLASEKPFNARLKREILVRLKKFKFNEDCANASLLEEYARLERELIELREAVDARRDEARARLKTIRELCGYIEDGTNQTIAIAQDDATKTWHIYDMANRLKHIAWGHTFEEMLSAAREALTKLDEK